MLDTDKICPIMFMTSHMGGLCQGDKCNWNHLCRDGIDLAGIMMTAEHIDNRLKDMAYSLKELIAAINSMPHLPQP